MPTLKSPDKGAILAEAMAIGLARQCPMCSTPLEESVADREIMFLARSWYRRKRKRLKDRDITCPLCGNYTQRVLKKFPMLVGHRMPGRVWPATVAVPKPR